MGDLQHSRSAAARRSNGSTTETHDNERGRDRGGGAGQGGAGQVGDSARTEGTTEREGTDGTTRVAGRRWAPEDLRGGVSRRGRLGLPGEGLRETLVGLQYRDPGGCPRPNLPLLKSLRRVF
jgi:hypothetical protein